MALLDDGTQLLLVGGNGDATYTGEIYALRNLAP